MFTKRLVSFDGDNYTRIGSLPYAIPMFKDKLKGILNRFNTDQYIIALTDGQNFRKKNSTQL